MADTEQPKHPGGRPSTYSAAIVSEIVERLADGESLRTICDDEHMPARSAVFKWLAKYPEFADQYARAREEQADAIFDEILNIADDGRNDWMQRNHGDDDPGWVANGEHIQRSRVRIDARKWMAGKLRPKKYADRMIHAGDDESPLTINIVRFSADRSTAE